MPQLRNFVFALTFIATFFSATLRAVEEHADDKHDSHVETSFTPPLGLRVFDGWIDPWPHADLSRRGTPFVHLFNLEPAFLDRDLILSYRFTDAADEREAELEAEIEW